MNRKMCKNYLDGVGCGIKEEYWAKYCPKNANSKCEIIPKKPKTKTFKAWIELESNGNMGQVRWHRENCYFSPVPCSITISPKYLKGK